MCMAFCGDFLDDHMIEEYKQLVEQKRPNDNQNGNSPIFNRIIIYQPVHYTHISSQIMQQIYTKNDNYQNKKMYVK